MAINAATALSLIKARLNRLDSDTTLDEYLTARLSSACAELEETGIILDDGADDLMLAVDYTVWQYQNRDKPGNMPDWLRMRRRERWVQEVGRHDT